MWDFVQNIVKCDDEDIEVCKYGVQVFCFNLLSVIVVVLIGLLSKHFWFSVIYIIFFVPIRMSCGGFHFKNPFLCFSTFSLSYFLIQYINISSNYIYIFVILEMIFFLLAKPFSVDDNLNSVTNIKNNKKRLVFISIIYTVFVCVYKNNNLANILFLSNVVNVLLYLIAMFNKNKSYVD